MSSFARQLSQIAQSQMSRNALSSWDRFKLPPSNDQIDALLGQERHNPLPHPYAQRATTLAVRAVPLPSDLRHHRKTGHSPLPSPPEGRLCHWG